MNRSESRYFATAARMDEAFLTLLAKKDFEYITVKEICEVAGVNRSTFYLHYETMSDFHYIFYRSDSAVGKNAITVAVCRMSIVNLVAFLVLVDGRAHWLVCLEKIFVGIECAAFFA